ncbi:MAG: PPC domain-containing DNA-binding protein [Candidatus Hermodarchaeota archaeon]
MKSREIQLERLFIVRLFKGEDVLQTLTNFAKEREIKSGFIVNGIGALEKASIGFFDPKKKVYLNNELGECEIVSLSGNIVFKDGEPFFHMHVALGNREGQVFGGHMNKGCIIGPTGEIIIASVTPELSRALDSITGLSLLNL